MNPKATGDSDSAGTTEKAFVAIDSDETGVINPALLGASLAASGAGLVIAGQTDLLVEFEGPAMVAVFVLGYAGIIFEESVAFNKSGVALLMAVVLWTIVGATHDTEFALRELEMHLADVSQIIYFLMGAMAIVEVVDAHQGFKIVTDAIRSKSSQGLLWTVGFITFFMSAILDNLTSTIVMISLLRKLVRDPKQRLFFGAITVIAANSGGAWTPIGDVTTTMLWINGQISTLPTMRDLVLPSFTSLVVPLAILSRGDEMMGDNERPEGETAALAPFGGLIFVAGIGALLFVPVFKSVTGLPPYMGMLGGLGALWLLTDAVHFGEKDRSYLRMPQALTKIDTQGVLFFLGVLLSISSLESVGVLKDLALFLDEHVPDQTIIAALIGLASAIIDNVPLVAATMGMYDVNDFPMDDSLWQLIAFCAGTGGSILIIGSAAGVAFMGMESVDFFW